MATRAIYTFRDLNGSFTVYKHWDGYPEGAFKAIKNAIRLAWPFPRFEASEFAAAFVGANKIQPGDIHLIEEVKDMGQDYHYRFTFYKGELHVEYMEGADDYKLSMDEWEKHLLEEK